jgi:hypothetical protein
MQTLAEPRVSLAVNRRSEDSSMRNLELHGGLGEDSPGGHVVYFVDDYPLMSPAITVKSLGSSWWGGMGLIGGIEQTGRGWEYLPAWSAETMSVVNSAYTLGGMESSSKRFIAHMLADAIVNESEGIRRLADYLQADAAAISVLRDGLSTLSKAFEKLDQDVAREQLRETATVHGREDFRKLLQRLAVDLGLSWHTIATMLGVTPTAIRKWRRGGSITAENREHVGAIAAFFDQLNELDIADLGSWIEMRVREDATLTPADVYRSGPNGRWLLLEWARGRIDVTTMLDRFDPDWREKYARDPNFRVVKGSDGERAIVPR